MDFCIEPRLSRVIGFSLLFCLLVSGFITIFLGLPITVILFLVLFSLHVDQVPQERLHKFSELFGFDGPDETREPYFGKIIQPAKSSTVDKDWTRTVLHRGGIFEAPENTLEAIREAANQRVAAVEIDLQFTADGVGILLHDDTLDRTTDASGDVRQINYSDLEDVNAAAYHKYRHRFPDPVQIPTLEECLLECRRHKLLVFIDCKAFAKQTADLVDELFNKYPDLYDTAVVCSFHPSIIFAMRRKNPRVITALTYRRRQLSCEVDNVTPRYRGVRQQLFTLADYLMTALTYGCTWYLCGNSFLLLNKESLSGDEVLWWKFVGVHLLPWTVNSEEEKIFCVDHLNLPIITDGIP